MKTWVWRHLGVFLGFAALSGVGWLCDFLTFAFLVKFLAVPGSVANFVSSYVGVTFVWIFSLHAVFEVGGPRKNIFLLVYWAFQFFSISAYSALIQQGAIHLVRFGPGMFSQSDLLLLSKIIVTPFNRLTNFIFMKFLTGYMKSAR